MSSGGGPQALFGRAHQALAKAVDEFTIGFRQRVEEAIDRTDDDAPLRLASDRTQRVEPALEFRGNTNTELGIIANLLAVPGSSRWSTGAAANRSTHTELFCKSNSSPVVRVARSVQLATVSWRCRCITSAACPLQLPPTQTPLAQHAISCRVAQTAAATRAAAAAPTIHTFPHGTGAASRSCSARTSRSSASGTRRRLYGNGSRSVRAAPDPGAARRRRQRFGADRSGASSPSAVARSIKCSCS